MWKKVTEGIMIPLKVTPKSSQNVILGWQNGELQIRINALPKKGDANNELVKFLSKEWKIAKAHIKIIFGLTSRHKRIVVTCFDQSFLEKLQKIQNTKNNN